MFHTRIEKEYRSNGVATVLEVPQNTFNIMTGLPEVLLRYYQDEIPEKEPNQAPIPSSTPTIKPTKSKPLKEEKIVPSQEPVKTLNDPSLKPQKSVPVSGSLYKKYMDVNRVNRYKYDEDFNEDE